MAESKRSSRTPGSTSFSTGLQAATRAVRSGACEEPVVAALCHDMATAISVENHGPIVAGIFKPYVSPASFDPAYDTLPLERFEPMIERVFRQPRPDRSKGSSVLAMSTTNRLARATDRARELAKQLEETSDLSSHGAERRLRELTAAERRSVMLVTALRSFYVALGSFASAALFALNRRSRGRTRGRRKPPACGAARAVPAGGQGLSARRS